MMDLAVTARAVAPITDRHTSSHAPPSRPGRRKPAPTGETEPDPVDHTDSAASDEDPAKDLAEALVRLSVTREVVVVRVAAPRLEAIRRAYRGDGLSRPDQGS